jgi:glycosyltransferase involved in cell wall biosynthesis
MINENLKKIEKFLPPSKKIESIGSAKLPLVSVIVTNYNYEKYLNECLESVLNIDYPYVQRIIVDDCSTDNSKEIIKEYEVRDFEIILKKNNEGQLAAFYSALEIVKGAFVIFVDADDLVDPDIINAHLSVHLFGKDLVGFSCVRNRQINAEGMILNNYHSDFKDEKKYLRKIKTQSLYKSFWVWSTTTAMMFRKDLLDLIKPVNFQSFRICADYYIVHFSNLIGESYLLNVPLVSYRRHGSNGFSKNLIIGGYKPTGHLNLHNHPAHFELRFEIISRMLNKRLFFEPYYGSLYSYAEILEKVLPYELICLLFSLEDDVNYYLKKVQNDKIKEINKKIEKYKLSNKEQKIELLNESKELVYEFVEFVKYIKELSEELPKKEEVFIYGTGEGAEILYYCIKYLREDINIKGFICDFSTGSFLGKNICKVCDIYEESIIISLIKSDTAYKLFSKIKDFVKVNKLFANINRLREKDESI